MTPRTQLDGTLSLSIQPPPTGAELAAIVAAVSRCIQGLPGADEGRQTMPEPSRWAAAGRREALAANAALPVARD